MFTCKDCVHYEVCKHHEDLYLEIDITGKVEKITYLPKVEDVCDYLKNKADFVEVVRCKECMFSEDAEYDQGIKPCVCRLLKRQMQPTDYCSYGERRCE